MFGWIKRLLSAGGDTESAKPVVKKVVAVKKVKAKSKAKKPVKRDNRNKF